MAEFWAENIMHTAYMLAFAAGKSSVVESLSGISVPRGEGIVTRCPLQLALRGVEGHDVAEGAIISYKRADGSVVRNKLSLKDVPAAIESATEMIAGTRKGIVDEVIQLQVFKANAPDLTLIDLPGITRNPVGKLLRAMLAPDKYFHMYNVTDMAGVVGCI